MKNISFGKEEDCPIPQRNAEDINDDTDLDLEDGDGDEQLEKVKNNNNFSQNKESDSGEEDDDSDKTSHENEEESKNSRNNKSENNNKNNDSFEEDENKEVKQKEEVKKEEEEKEEEEEDEDEKNEKKTKLNNENINKKTDIDNDEEFNEMKEKEKKLIESIQNKENVTKEKINLANEINFKSVPSGIIKTNEYGFLIENEENSKENKTNIKEQDNNPSNRKLELLQINARMEKWDLMTKNYDDFYKNKYNKLKSRTRKGVPDCFRSKVWQLFAEKQKYYKKNIFNNLDNVELKEDLDVTIIKDLDRTFPKCYFFKEKYGNGQRKLYRVLSNYSKYNTATGYVQGMGFIVALFLTYMDEESSFFMLDSLIKKYELEGFFLPNFPKLKGTFYVYLNLLKRYMPKTYELFKKEGIMPSMYATEWFICIFSRNLEFNVLVRVFDVFFLEGYKIVYRIALAIIKINEKKFFEKNEGIAYIMEVFKTIYDGIDPDSLIKIAFGFSLSRKDINKLEWEYETLNTDKNNEKNEFFQQL